MSFRRVCLTPGAAFNRRFRAPNWHRKHCLIYGEWPPVSALTAVKREFAADPLFSDPRYWAAFVLYGV